MNEIKFLKEKIRFEEKKIKFEAQKKNFDGEKANFEKKKEKFEIEKFNLLGEKIRIQNSKFLQEQKQTYLYVLQLEQGKYYIGQTIDLNKRLKQHFNGKGSAFTKWYKPERLIETFVKVDDFDENNLTKKYMLKYGINNVRGGSYCQMFLDKQTIQFLKREFYAINNCCFHCGNNKHSVEDCEELRYDDNIEEKTDVSFYIILINLLILYILVF